MKLQQFKRYLAKVNYHITDDLKSDLPIPQNGEVVTVHAAYRAAKDENFAGDMIFFVQGYIHTIPERDLQIIKEIKLVLKEF